MASWIVGIDGNFEEHWQAAEEAGLWDMQKPSPIHRGDTLHFWLTGKKELLGSAKAVSDTYPIGTDTPKPWSELDTERTYSQRVDLDFFRHRVRATPTFRELQALLGTTTDARHWPLEIPNSTAEQALDRYYEGPSLIEARLRTSILEALGHDERLRGMRLIALRQGQPGFRAKLLQAYKSTCPISRSSVSILLDAAHIIPYRGPHSNVPSNGLLLRTDLHTLFDAHLLTVTSDFRVRVAPQITDPTYRDFHGRRLTLPEKSEAAPDTELLSHHSEQCSWLA